MKRINHIRTLIRENGHISIDTFMDYVVSEYYEKQHTISQKGDFITSPEVSQLFGEMLGIWSALNWQEMGCPNEFIIVELGSGNGTLLDDLLRATKHIENFHSTMSVHIIEQSQYLISQQKKKLSQWKNINFHWHQSILDLPPLPSIIVANEFFDALPIKQFIKIRNEWHENVVTTLSPEGEFCISTITAHNNINEMLNHEYPLAKHRDVIEQSPYGLEFAKNIAKHIQTHKGSIAMIDYGYSVEPAERKSFISTLQAVKSHKYHPILQDIGNADLTAHVDFYSLGEVFKNNDCNVSQTITQREFLIWLGIQRRLEILMTQRPEHKNDLFSGFEKLISSEQMGDLFKVVTATDQSTNNIFITHS